MSEDRKKIFSKKGTGTVPKIKYGNNRINQYSSNQHNLMPNNLSSDWLRQDFSGVSSNCSQNVHSFNPYLMEPFIADDHNYSLPRQNSDLYQLNMTSNGAIIAANNGELDSRRDSVVAIPKCQNISKFPDKQKIEDKLNQIREYLYVTTSLMSTLKNSEDPQAVDKEKEHFDKMVKDLKDSEAKLLALLNVYENAKENQEELVENGVDNSSEPSTSGYQSNVSQRNEIEDKVEQSNRKILLLQEQQNALISLQKKAENQLLDAKQTQEKLLKAQQKQNEENRLRNDTLLQGKVLLDQVQANRPKITENNFDTTIRELEDTLNGLKTTHNNSDIDTLHERLENSNHLIHMLGTRDAQLNSEHMELQEKLNELQNKKQQIDQLASELQNFNEDHEDEDISLQVRKIVTMKQQLTKLKDMLEVVKNAELQLIEAQNSNDTDSESPENFNYVEKNDNVRQNIHSNQPNRIETIRIENNAISGEQWPIEKESNKISSNIREREKMLAELKAKKRELEEIIFKQKDRTLINNDICSESSINKSEMSGFEGAPPAYSLPPVVNRQNRSSSFYSSSDDCPEDVNEYSVIRTEPNFNHTHHGRLSKQRDNDIGTLSVNPPVDFSTHFQSIPSRSSECRSNTATSTTAPFNRPRERSTSANEVQNRNQIQKQLETIQGMCQSLIEQQNNNNAIGNNRNSHTPSPLYAEPRRYMSPGTTRESSVLNVVNPVTAGPNFPPAIGSQCYGPGNDLSSNSQNLLAANTLQFQSFLLNTLNQCCQMLWFQQREIASLRNTITLMQDRMLSGGAVVDQSGFRGGLSDPSATMSSFFNVPQPPLPPPPPIPSFLRSPTHNSPLNLKGNQQQQQVAAACSMPNLNQAYVPSASAQNNDTPIYDNRNNAAVRLLDFNNVQNNQSEQQHLTTTTNNSNNNNNNISNNATALHNINMGMNHHHQHSLPGQVWNGQALNNQVAPGNRANNYWDNFRSYSRQNLLSTSKSNEGVQNASGTSERSNRQQQQERSHSQCTNYTLPKSNAVQNESTNVVTTTSGDVQSRQFHSNKQTQSNSVTSTPRKSPSLIPPDVLNVSHVPDDDVVPDCPRSPSSPPNLSNGTNRKFNLRLQQEINDVAGEDRKFNYYLPQEQNNQPSIGRKVNLRMHYQDIDGLKKYKQSQERRVSVISNTSEESSAAKELPLHRNRNEWNDGEENANNSPKSKLFEQLRDSVYKEVANLISANEARPHFLIQLFRDLQLVNSDPLRHRTLHSIQTMITNPLGYSDISKSASSQTQANQTVTHERNTQVKPDFFGLDSVSVWPQSPASSSQTSSNMEIETNDPDISNVNNIVKMIVPFLKRHQDDIFQEELLEMLKALLIKAMPFGEIFANTNIQETTFHKHFAAIITEALYKFQGKRVQEIRKELIRTIVEVLLGEFSFIHLVQENIPECRELSVQQVSHPSLPLPPSSEENILMINLETVPQQGGGIDEATTPQIQNGDLAEADQSHVEEEEGAVGGAIGLVGDVGNEDDDMVVHDDSDTAKLDYPTTASTEVEADLEEQGLDEVPTRLTTSSRSHSGTPSRGKKKRKR